MIPDPQNVFEQLQNDVAAKLMQTAPFSMIAMPDGSPFNVLTEDEGDIQADFDLQIAQLGLAITVRSPTGKVDNLTDLPGPLLKEVGFDIWISEAPVFNRAVGGTQVRLAVALVNVLGAVHGFQPDSIKSPVYATGFDPQRERVLNGEQDSRGTLIVSRICHFIAPVVGLAIT